ncbi:MAG: ribonucleotide reductase N-terminal alpha domain-containing protein [Armatimonadota bacterium]
MPEKLSPANNLCNLVAQMQMEEIGKNVKEHNVELSQTAKTVVAKRYLLKDENSQPVESIEDLFWRVAVNIASADLIYEPFIDIKEKTKDFYNLMANLEFLPNSPTLMNAGRDLQQLSACFVLPVNDSMESIFETVKNTALIHKSGGGTGFSFTNLRPKNDRVSTTGGFASGPLSFMRVFNAATDVIKQGGSRRGANMAIMNVDHPDILEFITAKKDTNELTNFNLSVGVTEDFMEKVVNDQEYNLVNPNTKEVVDKLRAREIFDLIVEMAWHNGEPGIVFIDRLNKSNPTPHIGTIESTNPCITGDSLVSTQYGLMRMDRLVEMYSKGGLGVVTDNRVDQYMNARMEGTYNQPVVEFEDGVSVNLISRAVESGEKEVYKIVTRAGFELTATPDHKIMTTDGWVKTGDLKPDVHKILLQSGEGGFSKNKKLPFEVRNKFKGKNGKSYKLNLPSEWSYELGLVLGSLVGDGWLRDGDKNCRVGFTFGKDDLEVLDIIKPILNEWYGFPVKEVERENGVIHLSYHSKYFVEFFKSLGIKPVKADDKRVPESIFTAPREAVIGFLKGLFTADGTAAYDKENSNYYVRLTSKSEELLKDTQKLLINLGIFSRIYDRSRLPKEKFSYTNSKGEEKTYICDGILFEVNINRINARTFLNKVGFIGSKHQERVKKLKNKKFPKMLFEDKILEVVKTGWKKVYDLTEPASNSFCVNGLVVSNCGEQPLLPYEACNLGSINLSKMVKEKDGSFEVDYKKLERCTRLAVQFLDNVIDMNKYPLKQIDEMVKGNRKIGLGVMGFADLLIMLGIQYNSNQAVKLAEELMGFIQEIAYSQSTEIAKRRGPFPNYKGSVWEKKGKRLRNATVTTIAPTGTLSIIANCSSGIEPLFGICFIRQILGGEKFVEVNPVFKYMAEKEDFYSEELMEEIAQKGTLKNVRGVPAQFKKLFATSYDVTPSWHVKMQAAFQKYTDNAVSKTVNFPEDATRDDIKQVFDQAYSEGCKGITIYRHASRGEQVISVGTATPQKSPKQQIVAKNVLDLEDASFYNFEHLKTYRNLISPRSRPEVTFGLTEKVQICEGNVYITINYDEYGICEVLVQGKEDTGGCSPVNFEVLGKFISLAISSGVQIKHILEQIKGKKCAACMNNKEAVVLSCSDAVARVLERAWVKTPYFISLSKQKIKAGLDQPAEAMQELGAELRKIERKAADNGKASGNGSSDICPECEGPVEYVEGCAICRNCGYSKCG